MLQADLAAAQASLTSEREQWASQHTALSEEKARLQSLYDQAQQELAESESIVQECLEDKRRGQKSPAAMDADLGRAIDGLRKQLGAQQESVARYEAKVKKRESELKEKSQELRRLRADAANAKLQVTKITAERDTAKKELAEFEVVKVEREEAQRELEDVRQKYYKAVETVENKVSENVLIL